MVEHVKAANKKAAAIALFCKSSILLGRRIEFYKGEKVPFGGNWSLFGGRIEQGESPLDAAVREMKEETCIEIKGDPIFIRKYKTYNRYDFWAYALSIDYLPKVKINFEHDEYGFFSPENLPQPMDPQIKKNIKLSLENIRCI